MGRFVSVETLHVQGDTEVVVARAEGRPARAIILGRDREALRRHKAVLDEVAGAGIPGTTGDVERIGDRYEVGLDLPATGDLLAQLPPLAPAALREMLGRLMDALARAHGRGHVHGAITAECIVVDSDGQPWLLGWHASTPIADSGAVEGFDAVAFDIRSLGTVFARLDNLEAEPGPAGRRSRLGPDRDFHRVLARLAAPDSRDAYTSADEVLRDLGEVTSLDPWDAVPFVERPGVLQALDRGLRAWREARAGGVPLVASYVLEGRPRSGRTRTLAEAAAALRVRGVLVLRAAADDGSWGGLSELTVQMLSMVGRGAEALNAHLGVIEKIAHGASPPGESDVTPAADALVALAEGAFAEESGALLLDDIDDMPRAALDVWNAVSRRVVAGAHCNATASMLFVSTAVSVPERDDDAPRSIIRLSEWDLSDVETFLSGVLEDAATARACAPVLRSLAGGLPGELVDVLRDLERGGGLRRVCDWWRVELTLSALADWSQDDAESVRLALRAAGREAIALVEVLAVADEPLTREDCARYCEQSGPRLWQAAEAADRSGLVRRDGGTWRIRSARIRQRVLSAMSASRRASLHRELLFTLRERRPDDLPTHARHARAAGHPEAATLTDGAVRQLTEAGRSDSAIAHLEDAEHVLGEPDWGRARWLQRADLLREAGRLAEAVELLGRARGENGVSPDEIVDAAVLLARVRYEAREWEEVLAIELPETVGTPSRLAQLRYLRGAAWTQLYDLARAEREARLAAAECAECSDGFEVTQARLEYEYKIHYQRGEYEAAARALLEKMRHAARNARRQSFPFDVVRFAQSARHVTPRRAWPKLHSHARSMVCRVDEGRRHVRGMLEGCVAWMNAEPAVDHAEANRRSAAHYWDTGVPGLRRLALVRRFFVVIEEGRYDGRHQGIIDELADAADRAPIGDVLAWAGLYSLMLGYLGRQPDLFRLSTRLRSLPEDVFRSSIVHRAMVRSALLWCSPASEFLHPRARPHFRAMLEPSESTVLPSVTTELDPVRYGCYETPAAIAAWSLNARSVADVATASDWDLPRMMAWLGRPSIGPGELALALAIGVWRTSDLDVAQWRIVMKVRALYDDALFPSLRWQASLVDSRSAWFEGDVRAAVRHYAKACDRAEWLRMDRFGAWGQRAADRAVDALSRWRPVVRKFGETSRAEIEPRARRYDYWPLALVRTADAVHLRTDTPEDVVWVLQMTCAWQAPVAGGVHVDGMKLIVALPELLGDDDIDAVMRKIASGPPGSRRVILASTLSREQVGSVTGRLAGLIEAVGGVDVTLRTSEWRPIDRSARFMSCVRRGRESLTIEPDALVQVAVHAWRGGYAEMERTARAVSMNAASGISVTDLVATGWALDSAGPDEVDRRILLSVIRFSPCSVRRLTVELAGVPRRTLQRRLAVLHEGGYLRRRGRARSTTYAFVWSEM